MWAGNFITVSCRRKCLLRIKSRGKEGCCRYEAEYGIGLFRVTRDAVSTAGWLKGEPMPFVG